MSPRPLVVNAPLASRLGYPPLTNPDWSARRPGECARIGEADESFGKRDNRPRDEPSVKEVEVEVHSPVIQSPPMRIVTCHKIEGRVGADSSEDVRPFSIATTGMFSLFS